MSSFPSPIAIFLKRGKSLLSCSSFSLYVSHGRVGKVAGKREEGGGGEANTLCGLLLNGVNQISTNQIIKSEGKQRQVRPIRIPPARPDVQQVSPDPARSCRLLRSSQSSLPSNSVEARPYSRPLRGPRPGPQRPSGPGLCERGLGSQAAQARPGTRCGRWRHRRVRGILPPPPRGPPALCFGATAPPRRR